MENNSFTVRSQKLIKNLIISFYIIVLILGILIFVGFILPMIYYSPPLQIFIGLLLGIVGIIVGSLLSVIIDLNTDIYKKYDIIKNDIANNKIKTIEEFSEIILKFIIESFNYTFLDINISFIKVKHSNYYFSDEKIINYLKDDFSNFESLTKKNENIITIGKKNISDSNYYIYLLPIWFGDEWLGYLGLLSKNKIFKFFLKYLDDFEDYYLDDQLLHVLNKKYLLEQKQMFREIDKFSDKISENKYKCVKDYCIDLLKYFTSKLHCYGGMIKFSKHKNIFYYFNNLPVDKNNLINFFKNKNIPTEQNIIHYPGFINDNIITFQIPIGIKTPFACIYLFSDREDIFSYYNKIIYGIEDIKLDNDFENIMSKLPIE